MEASQIERLKVTTRVTLVGSVLDITLGFLKIIFGFSSHSHALLVDGVHSLSDVVTDIFVIIVSRVSHSIPDEKHPYGHGRFETIGTVTIGALLIAVAGALAYDNTLRLIQGETQLIPTWPALVIAALSIGSKEWIYHYTVRAGKKYNSNLLIANAWHSRTDAFSSIVVFIGVACAMAGYPTLDAVAAIIVALIIGKVGFSFLWKSLMELADTSLDKDLRKEIKEKIYSIEGVKGMHNLRSRSSGQHAILDVNVEVDPNMTVSEGHAIASWVSKVLIESFTEIIDVTVHIDVENDMVSDYSSNQMNLLPLRGEITSQLNDSWNNKEIVSKILDINLHYLADKINVDVVLPVYLLDDPDYSHENVQKVFREDCSKLPWLKDITACYRDE